MEEESWMRNHLRISREASGRLLGDIWKVSGEHVRAIWEASGSWEGQGRPEAVLEEKVIDIMVFYSSSECDPPF